MAFKTPWNPVYPDISKLPERDVNRLTINALRADTNTILSATVNPAIFNLICQKALKDTADFIRTNNLDYGNSTELIEWICKRTFTPPVVHADTSDDGRTEEKVCNGSSQCKVATARIGEVDPGRGGNKGKRKKE